MLKVTAADVQRVAEEVPDQGESIGDHHHAEAGRAGRGGQQ